MGTWASKSNLRLAAQHRSKSRAFNVMKPFKLSNTQQKANIRDEKTGRQLQMLSKFILNYVPTASVIKLKYLHEKRQVHMYEH